MANSGNTTTSALADSLPTVLAEARIVREYEGNMPQLVDTVNLGEGVGLTWNELSYAKLTAQSVAENEELNNPQQISDTLFSITPTVVGIHTVITDRVAMRIAKVGFNKLGALAQNAIQRKKDQDGIVVLDGASTSLCGAGTTMASGYINAAVSRITGNTTEPGNEPIHCVLHPYGIKDLADEIIAGVGTYAIDKDGLTARVYQEGFAGMVGGAKVFRNGNITIDSADDAKGGVFAKEAIVLVQGKNSWAKVVRNEKLGGGASEFLLYDEYAYGERSAGNWLYELRVLEAPFSAN